MNMGNLNKLALTAQEALQQTLSIASDAQAAQAEPIHMLKALLESKENNLSAIIKRIGADPASMRASVDAHIESMPKVSGSNAPFGMSGIPGQALLNLLDNAVKYAAAQSVIALWLERRGRGVRLRVENRVESFSREDLENMFERFYRADVSRNSASGGYGIGLSIARSIAEGHRGTIRAESPDGRTIVFTAELK